MPSETITPLVFRHPVSACSHLAFALYSAYVLALFLRLTRTDGVRCRSSFLFGLSLVTLYLISGLYHAVPADRPALVDFFRRLDLAAIHLLIAGTCTPVFAVLLPRAWGWPLLATIWALALAGALTKGFLPLPPYPVTIGLYLALGIGGLVPILCLASLGWPGRIWLLGGAGVYAVGGCCEALRWPMLWPGVVGAHEVLHLCDMIGSCVHIGFILRYVVAQPR